MGKATRITRGRAAAARAAAAGVGSVSAKKASPFATAATAPSSPVLRSAVKASRLRHAAKTSLSTSLSVSPSASLSSSTSSRSPPSTSSSSSSSTLFTRRVVTTTVTTSTNTTTRLYRVTPFARVVYAYCRLIPRGAVVSYAALAAAVGAPLAYRAVGVALSRNPFAPHVPCHRVVASGGGIGGFMGQKQAESEELRQKVRLLKAEGVEVREGRVSRVEDALLTRLKGTLKAEDMTDERLASPLMS